MRALLKDGGAYGYASGGYIHKLEPVIREEVIAVYVKALQTVWQAIIAFSCVGFLLVFVEKHVELRKDLNTEYGLEEKSEKQKEGDLEAGQEKNERLDSSAIDATEQR